MTVLRWFLSKSVRQATDLGRHVHKLTRAQSDLLGSDALQALSAARLALRQRIREGQGPQGLQQAVADLERSAAQHLRPYPHPTLRDNLEVILVALALALAIRTFFLQPFKIPTGSMQPTLYGITAQNLLETPDQPLPSRWKRWIQAAALGTRYYHVVAEADGAIEKILPPRTVVPLIRRQQFVLGGRLHTIWFPPSTLPQYPGVDPANAHLLLFAHGGADPGRVYRRGETILKLKVVAGDHLFVDRLTYNFRPPERGEIVVFQTRGIAHPRMPQDQFYIKRLVGLGGETLRIGPDRHLIVDGIRLDASTPRFENVYGFRPQDPPRDSRYSGHVAAPALGPWITDAIPGYTLPPHHYVVLGDNTVNSFDSRGWGAFSRTNVIGKSFLVYWPFNSRFGWSAR